METKIKKVDLIFEKVDYLAILEKSKKRSQDEIILDIIDSGLRGRGGLDFPPV
jgi:[NiFe] hydrogenase diaphorase moiety large subunit